MTVITLPHKFEPRPYQIGAWQALYAKGIKRFYFLQHRRSGKDRVALNLVIQLAMQRRGLYLYLFPQQNQVRKAIWKGISADGIPFLTQIPAPLIKKTNGTEMSVEFINGSILQFAGSNNVDALVGTNPVLIVQSELALQNPFVRTYLSPILAENDGVEIILTTPRGKNHAYELYENVKNNPLWYVTNLTIEDTKRHDGSPVITLEQIEEERRNGMAEEMIRQEFYCDWNVGVQGAYYTRELDLAEREKRIGVFERSRSPCWTFWDLGVSDATSVWVMQPNGPWIDLIAHYENNNFGVDHYIRWLEELRQKWNLTYRAHYAPHDIRQRQWATGARTRIELAREQGIQFMIAPNISVEDGISAVRAIFERLRFHLPDTKSGLDALREYRREYDEVRRCFHDKPLHNWASNCADSLRYLAVTYRDLFTKPHVGNLRYQEPSFSPPELEHYRTQFQNEIKSINSFGK